MAQASVHLDWCAATFASGTPIQNTLPEGVLQDDLRFCGRGRYGYRQRYEGPQGIQIMLGGTDAQGVHVVIPGGALARLRDGGLTDLALCQHIMSKRGKVARLDVALDIQGGSLTPRHVQRLWRRGQVNTPARSGLMRLGVWSNDQTLTLGQRSSSRYMRIYDKRAESHTDGPAWVRFELECHKLTAHALASKVSSAVSPGPVLAGALRGFCDMDHPEYRDALANASSVNLRVPENQPSRLKFLLEQALPCAVRLQAERPDLDVWAILTSAYNAISSAERVGAADDGFIGG